MRIVRLYDESEGKSEVILYEDGLVARGRAYLHEDDREFGNKSTGLSIAHYRALASLYYKKAMKEYDIIIFLSNRYKSKYSAEKFYQDIEARAHKYLEKAMEFSVIADDVVETKEMFYRRMEGLRNGEISTMQFVEDLSDILGEDFKKAIDEGMSMEIPEIENENSILGIDADIQG